MRVWIPTIICSLLCAYYCFRQWKQSKDNASKGIIDNGAQNALSAGVFFTFLGISWALWNFETNPNAMGENIGNFISGMRTAFWTSVIGMMSSYCIKWKQSNIERNDDCDFKNSLANIKEISDELKNNTYFVTNALNELKQSVDIGTQTNKANTSLICDALVAVKSSVDAGSSEKLGNDLQELAVKIGDFVSASDNSREDMKKLSSQMEKQSAVLQTVSDSLSGSIAVMGDRQERLFTEFGESLSGSIDKLSNELNVSGRKQLEQLGQMNDSVMLMKENSIKSATDAAALLKQTKEYQEISLANDDKQADILSQNTASIVEMKESFRDFEENVAKVFGEGVIKALNESMKNLNEQLEEQFGENFKELNAAVREVVTWQENYKDIVEKTTDELKYINSTFTEFTEVIAKEISSHIESLTDNLTIFTSTSEKNVAVQKDLNHVTEMIVDTINIAKENVNELKKLVDGFNDFTTEVVTATNTALNKEIEKIDNCFSDFTAEVIVEINEAMEKEKTAIETHLHSLTASLEEITHENIAQLHDVNDVAFDVANDTREYLTQFGNVSKDVMRGVRESIEAFKDDFNAETEQAVQNLNAAFKQLAENTDKQGEKAVNSLAGALGTISEQMIDNYQALISRIAELDKLIQKNGGKY